VHSAGSGEPLRALYTTISLAFGGAVGGVIRAAMLPSSAHKRDPWRQQMASASLARAFGGAQAFTATPVLSGQGPGGEQPPENVMVEILIGEKEKFHHQGAGSYGGLPSWASPSCWSPGPLVSCRTPIFGLPSDQPARVGQRCGPRGRPPPVLRRRDVAHSCRRFFHRGSSSP
jgi:hypothetical protein